MWRSASRTGVAPNRLLNVTRTEVPPTWGVTIMRRVWSESVLTACVLLVIGGGTTEDEVSCGAAIQASTQWSPQSRCGCRAEYAAAAPVATAAMTRSMAVTVAVRPGDRTIRVCRDTSANGRHPGGCDRQAVTESEAADS